MPYPLDYISRLKLSFSHVVMLGIYFLLPFACYVDCGGYVHNDDQCSRMNSAQPAIYLIRMPNSAANLLNNEQYCKLIFFIAITKRKVTVGLYG